MNRTHASVPPTSQQLQSLVASKLVDSQWTKTWNCASGDLGADVQSETTFPGVESQQPELALFAPLHYEPGYAYPLIVWLHSDGGSQRELPKVMPHLSLRNHVAVAVQGTDARDSRSGQFAWSQQPDEVAEAALRVKTCVDIACDRYHVHSDRVFVAGFEGGGTMALRLGLAHPEWFAGAISLEGPMPQGNSPLIRVNQARSLPIMLASCRESETYPETRVASDLRLLHSGGFSLSIRQYPGQHELTTEMLADVDRWILEQFCC